MEDMTVNSLPVEREKGVIDAGIAGVVCPVFGVPRLQKSSTEISLTVARSPSTFFFTMAGCKFFRRRRRRRRRAR